MKRIPSIDFVRGLVMIIMALDHIRDMIFISSGNQDPTDLSTTTPMLFMTRWITHLCAPTFVFLSGTSAYLSMRNQENYTESRRFLLKRGLWLVFLNFTLVNFAIFFDIHFSIIFLQVIAAIGFSFIGLGLLLKLSARTLGILGLLIIFGHDLFAGVSFPRGTPLDVIWTIFMGAGFYQISPQIAFLTTYPIIPWLGIMLVGFSCGEFLNQPAEDRTKLFLKIGFGALAIFTLIRTFNIYGDTSHWAFQKNVVFSFLSFINTSKYPPSLLYTLMTLGISFILLAVFDSIQNRFTDIVSIYGKVPLFYYLIHWFVIHAVAFSIFIIQGYHWSDFQFEGFSLGRPKEGGGLGLMGIYIVWFGIVALLYPVCRWYAHYKIMHKENTWLRYL